MAVRRRLGLRSAICAFAVLAVVALASFDADSGEAAAPPPETSFQGRISDGGTITIVVGQTSASANVTISYGGTPTAGCAHGASISDVEIDEGFLSAALVTTSLEQKILLFGIFDEFQAGAIAGSYEADPLSGACPLRRLSWYAIRTPRPAITATLEAGDYVGEALVPLAPDSPGQVAVTVSGQGTVTSIALTLALGDCTYSVSVSTPTVIVGGHYFTASSGGASLTGVLGEDALAGGFAHPGSNSCAPISGVWGAGLDGGAVSATPTPPPAGQILSGSIPHAGGIGLIVFGGGTSAQLVAASGCPSSSAAFWASDTGSFVTFVPGTSISAVNAAWNTKFAAGIPPNTVLIGQCR